MISGFPMHTRNVGQVTLHVVIILDILYIRLASSVYST
jgi:hypothetical protein